MKYFVYFKIKLKSNMLEFVALCEIAVVKIMHLRFNVELLKLFMVKFIMKI